MRFISITLIILLASSCATQDKSGRSAKVKSKGQLYTYRDVGGEFEYAREVKIEKSKIVTRIRIVAPGSEGEQLLEKTFAISAVGSVKSEEGRLKAIRPELFQHTVWLEGKKYFSQLKLNPRKRAFEAILESPEEKWNGRREIKLPRGRIFCFYSQLPECLINAGMISESKRSARFIMIWDSWPYHQEHFTGLTSTPFANATVLPEKKSGSIKRYTVEVSGQALSLHFSKDGAFVRMFWTNQGISILPPAEAQNAQEI
jgi:hypothetical protein